MKVWGSAEEWYPVYQIFDDDEDYSDSCYRVTISRFAWWRYRRWLAQHKRWQRRIKALVHAEYERLGLDVRDAD